MAKSRLFIAINLACWLSACSTGHERLGEVLQSNGLDLMLEERSGRIAVPTTLYGIDPLRGALAPVQSIEVGAQVSRFSGINAFVNRSNRTRLELVQLDPPGFVDTSALEDDWAFETRSSRGAYFSFRSCPRHALVNDRLVSAVASPFAAHLLSSPRAEFPYALAVDSSDLVFVAQPCKAERRGPLEELSAIMAPAAVMQGSLSHLSEAETILLHNVYRRIARNTYSNVLGWRVSDEVISTDDYVTILKALNPRGIPNQSANFQLTGPLSTTGQPAFDQSYLEELQKEYAQRFGRYDSGERPPNGFSVRFDPGEVDLGGAIELARALTILWGKEVQISIAPSDYVYVRFGTEDSIDGDQDFDIWLHTHPTHTAPDGTLGAVHGASVILHIENGTVQMDQKEGHDLLWAYRRKLSEIRIVTAFADVTHVIPWGQTIHVRTTFGRVPVHLPVLNGP